VQRPEQQRRQDQPQQWLDRAAKQDFLRDARHQPQQQRVARPHGVQIEQADQQGFDLLEGRHRI